MNFITKEQSNFIKGVAIVLMLIHHLFAYSERYPANIEIYFLIDSIRYEQLVGEIGKYCVPIFLFISGYGFSKSSQKNTEIGYYLNKILYIFIGYWLVFIIFVPLSYYFSEWKFVNLEPRFLVSNFLGISSSYNGEWWFFLPYILLILLTPLFHKLASSPISLMGISFVLYGMSWVPSEMQNFFYWQPAYILGFLFPFISSNLINFIHKRRLLMFLLCLFIVIFGNKFYGWDSMPFLVVFFVIIIRLCFDFLPKWVVVTLNELGRKSLFIWLTHSFYCYHFAKEVIYYPKYTVLIFINLLLISYLSALILSYIYSKVILKLKSIGLTFKEN